MTPKETANKLYHKFYFVNAETVELITGEHELLFSLSPDDAKKCALICVDELKDEIIGLCGVPYETYEYWDAVKQEIEKL